MVEFPDQLKENLYPDEKVLFTLERKLSFDVKPKYLIVTDRRVLFFDQKILGRYDLNDLPYERLEEVKFYQGSIGSEFRMKDESGVPIIIKWLDNKEIKEAMVAIKDAIDNISIEPVAIQKKKKLMGREEWTLHKPKEMVVRSSKGAQKASAAPQAPAPSKPEPPQRVETVDPIEKLKKLKGLLDMGAITEEEFEDKKEKLLEDI